MGWGNVAAEGIADAQQDMAAVQAAAEAIIEAIGSARPWLNGQTWSGQAATSWCDSWQGSYRQVEACLNSLPAAEGQVVDRVRTQMEALIKAHAADRQVS